MANLRIAELDFDTIKTNLKNYLQSQAEFTDYDFEGSALSILLDILAYNTHYNAYLANMLSNEMFLDSAIKRSSVVSIAKHLGYTPRSVRGATATLNVTVNNPTGLPTSLTMERYTPFTTSIDGTTYTFQNLEPITITPVGGVYTFTNLTVKEGAPAQFYYTVVNPGTTEKYEIPTSQVDTSTLLVTVQNSSTDTTTTTYNLTTDISLLDGTSTVFFLEETPLGTYQIYFGDGVIGKKLSAGNIVTIRYLISNSEQANTSGTISQSFTCGATIGGSSNINVTTVSNSSGGTSKETISSIKYNAPLAYYSKNRAVTKSDYASIIKAAYTQVEAISVWGGEENEPPVYGKVFISLKPFDGFVINDAIKNDIVNTTLKDKQVITTEIEFVDPDYIYVNLVVDVNYNKNLTTLSASQISNSARNVITNYFSTQVQNFEKPFYLSQLTNNISEAESSILSVLVAVNIQKRILPALNVTNSFQGANSLKFNNKLHPGHFQSTRFLVLVGSETVTVRMYDVPDISGPAGYDSTGVIKLLNVNTNLDVATIGTINYATGEVSISGITPIGYPAGQFDIAITCEAQESSYNIAVAKNQIIVLDNNTESEVAGRLPGLTINVNAV